MNINLEIDRLRQPFVQRLQQTRERKRGNAMAVDIDDQERFHGARLCCKRVLSHCRPKVCIVYSSRGRACRSEGPQFCLSLLFVLCPSRTSLHPAYLRYRVHVDYIQSCTPMSLPVMLFGYEPYLRYRVHIDSIWPFAQRAELLVWTTDIIKRSFRTSLLPAYLLYRVYNDAI